jgi:hypothetical protein
MTLIYLIMLPLRAFYAVIMDSYMQLLLQKLEFNIIPLSKKIYKNTCLL